MCQVFCPSPHSATLAYMAYDEHLAERIRVLFEMTKDIDERKMFGGLAFMYRGKMCIGVNKDVLMVRVGPDRYEEALRETGAREMDFTGRSMRGYVSVDAPGYETDEQLEKWVDWSKEFVEAL